MIEDGLVYCPICGEEFPESDYLKNIFVDIKTRWLANMVTHYRHEHITSWNRCWNFYGHYYRSGWFQDYEREKNKVNERAKRQILRKAKEFLKENGFSVIHFECLQGTEEKTLGLAHKILSTNPK